MSLRSEPEPPWKTRSNSASLPYLADHGVLALLEDVRAQLHRARLVGAVDVAEGGGEDEATEAVERLIDGDHVLGRGVELLGRGVLAAGGAVFLTADDTGFHFEDDLVLGAELEVFLAESSCSRRAAGPRRRACASGTGCSCPSARRLAVASISGLRKTRRPSRAGSGRCGGRSARRTSRRAGGRLRRARCNRRRHP